jgi:drug/metabolite transporter (DMT)-like permease
MKWLLVGLVVAATCASDLLQSKEMKRQAARGRFGFSRTLAVAVVFMALAFFSFLELLKISDLSFAVPATAATLVLETALANWLLRENVTPRRWVGAVLVSCGVALLART